MPRSAVTIARLLPPLDPAPPDVPLLRAFVASNGEAAFEELVHRHGPMVLAVCRRVLGHAHDAEDAFQATFIVLARKAATIRGNLAGWLYGVAVRTARGVRVMRDRRRKHELLASPGRQPGECCPPDHDLAAVIDEELAKLPDHYREALVLCELRGLSRKQAATELGIAEGTLSSRLAVGKRKLAARLAARGLATPAALVSLLAPATLSAALVRSAASVARGAAGPVASAAASAVVKGMLFDQLKAVALAGSILLTAVCGGLAMTGGSGDPVAQAAVDPVAKLVDQLGAPEFADREVAAKQLREMGFKAEAALRAGLRSESPEVRDRSAKLLAEIRAVARTALVKQFDPATDAEPDHPVWKRFKSIAGNDAAARKLFAEIIADPKRLKMLDDADREPGKAGDLYAKEVRDYYKSVEWRNPWGSTPNGPKRPWADELAILYLGTYPASAAKFPRDDVPGDRLEVQLFWSWDEALKAPAAPAVRRVFAEWLALRANPEVQRQLFEKVGRDRVAEALPLMRTILADAKAEPVRRAEAALLIGVMGTRADVALLRQVAQSPNAATAEPYEKWNVILKGKEKFDSLWADYRFGGKNEPGAWEQAWKEADVRRGDRSVADCAWAAAVKLAGGKPEELGFLYPQTLAREKISDDLFYYPSSHGFPDGLSRIVAHHRAIVFLDQKAKEKEEPKPNPAVLKLIEQLGAAEFADREAAEKDLKELGSKAKPAVLAGLKSENPEIVQRCRAVFDHIRVAEAKAAFLKAAGDDDAARALLAEVLKDAHRAKVLDEAVQHPERSGKLYAAEQWRLWQKAVSTPPGATEADIPTAPEIALSFLLGAHPSSADALKTEPPPDDPRISEGCRAVESGLLCKSLQLELIEPKRRGPFARLMAGWLATRSDPWLIGLGLSEARQYRLTEVVPVARQVVRNAKLDAQHRAVAALALADLGGKAELPVLQGLMDDKTEYSRSREGRNLDGPTLTVELRDVAVGATLLLSGQDPGEFGFPEFRRQAVAELKMHEKLSGRCFAFTSNADREAAHKRAREWLDEQKKKDEPKKDEPNVTALVEQLGAAEFADREAAAKTLREMGLKAEAALRAGLKSENPEVRERCGKLLTEVRADARDALAKNFKPDGTDDPDHAIWKRFKTVAGRDKSARALFAHLIADPRRLKLLDDAERDPDKIGELYAHEAINLYKGVVSRQNRPWQDAVVVYLGTYPATAGPLRERNSGDHREEMELENTIHHSLHLVDIVQEMRPELFDDVVRPPPGTAEEFIWKGSVKLGPNDSIARESLIHAQEVRAATPALKRLLPAWYEFRDHSLSDRGMQRAVSHDPPIAEFLPFARKVAADVKRSAKSRCHALAIVTLFGSPADRPLFEHLFADETTIDTIDYTGLNPPGASPDKKGTIQARDAAAGLALLLYGEEPADYGFPMATYSRAKPGERPNKARHDLGCFGFPNGDDKARAATHEKVKAFFDKQPKLKKEEPTVPEKGEKFWPRFSKLIGDDKASRALFDLIVANAKNLELLEKVTETPDSAGTLYHERWKELNKAAHIPTGPGSSRIVHAPLVESLGWIYLGTFAGTEGSPQQSFSVDFLPLMPPAKSAQDELRDVLKDEVLSTPMRRLIGTWTAARADTTGRQYGLEAGIAYDIAEVLPAARATLTRKVKDDPYPGNTARVVGVAILTVGKLGTKDDLVRLEQFADDKTQCGVFLHDPPPKPGEPVPPRLIRMPRDGQDTTTQLRDVSAAMRLHIVGQKPEEFGFYWSWPFGDEAGKPNNLGTFHLYTIGFLRAADREAAHKKAKAWFDKKEEPKKNEPDPAAKLVEQLGAAEFADREAAQKELRKLGYKAETAIKAGLKSENPEVVKRCNELLDAIRADLLVGKDSPAWAKFKAVAGDDAEARKLYLRTIGTRQRAEMILAAIEDPKKAAVSFAKECEEIGKIMDYGRSMGVALRPKPPGFPDRDVTPDDLAALLFLSNLAPLARDGEKREQSAVIGHVLISGLTGETKAAFGKLFAAWAEPRPWAWSAAFNIALTERVTAMTPVARKALTAFAAKERTRVDKADALALRLIGWYGTTDDIPLLMKFADDKTACGSMSAGGKEDGTVVQVRDLAAIAALTLRKQRLQDFGFAMHDIAPPWPADFLANHGFDSDADREAAHKKAREWLEKQKK